jgi:hypothetical protein
VLPKELAGVLAWTGTQTAGVRRAGLEEDGDGGSEEAVVAALAVVTLALMAIQTESAELF